MSFFLLKVKTHPDPDMRQLKPGTPWGEPPEASVSYPRGFRLSEPLPMVIAVLWMVCKLVGVVRWVLRNGMVVAVRYHWF